MDLEALSAGPSNPGKQDHAARAALHLLMVRPGRRTQSTSHIACPPCACQAGRRSLEGLQTPVPSQRRIGPGRTSAGAAAQGPGRVGAVGAHPHPVATKFSCSIPLTPGHIVIPGAPVCALFCALFCAPFCAPVRCFLPQAHICDPQGHFFLPLSRSWPACKQPPHSKERLGPHRTDIISPRKLRCGYRRQVR